MSIGSQTLVAHSPTLRPTHILAIWLGYVFFVVYGSLVPLDFKPLPLDQAWEIFRHIPMYKLGVESRADWIANGVLYVPVGFLTAHLAMQKHSATWRIPLFLLSGLFSFALAFGVEFSQMFFPPRTVSLNDLLAESLGSLVGLVLAMRYSDWFKTVLHTVFSNPRQLALRLLEAYFVGYVVFSFFPYDVLLSGAELGQKLRGNGWGWLIAGDGLGKIQIVLKLFAEVVLTFPIGMFLGYRSAHQPATFKKAVLIGLVLGILIEIAQFFIASGISQGLSVITRIAGICGGLTLWQQRANCSPTRLATTIKRYVPLLGATYLWVLLELNGWFTHHWNGLDFAASRLGELHYMPFYYHYFTSEARALVSLTLVCLSYFPIGLLTWSIQGSSSQAFMYAMFTAGLVETGKLFLEDMHPDPTNVLLGALASWIMFHLSTALSKAVSMSLTTEVAVVPASQGQNHAQAGTTPSNSGEPARRWPAYCMLLPSLAFAAYWAATFPTQPLLLTLFLTTCAAIIWHRPILLVAILPAALPVLDLAPWSGRFYLEEFDLLMLIGLAIGYTRIPPARGRQQKTNLLFTLISGMVAISFFISALRGLLPWQFPDANAFTNYYSPFNALRIFKGALWAFLSYGLLQRMAARELDIKRCLTVGMVIGLALTIAVILWERLTFSGLFNFASDYRVTGPFSSMHTGGAYIECFLSIATPFLVLLILLTRNWVCKLLGTALLLATTYALMVTISRNGYMAFGVSLVIILFFVTFKSGRWRQRSMLALALSGAMLAVAFPVFTGKFAQDRMATIGNDLAFRQAHWVDALNIRNPNWLTLLFGMGLGRYPESHYLLSSEESHSGTYQLMSEGQNTFLRLVSGSSIYVDQIVSVKPRQKYLLKIDARTNKPDGTITLPICEKWLLTSFTCMWSTLDIGKETGVWRHFEVHVNSDEFNISHWYSQRPIKLGLYNGNAKTIIDIDNVRLETIDGEDLVANGDFARGMDHWFFSADSHLEWHTKSLPVAILFDQGWFGVVTLSLFSLLAIRRAAGRAWRGDLYAAAFLASFCGFLIVGLFDTLIDAPRFLFAFLLLGWFCCYGNQEISTDNRKLNGLQ